MQAGCDLEAMLDSMGGCCVSAETRLGLGGFVLIPCRQNEGVAFGLVDMGPGASAGQVARGTAAIGSPDPQAPDHLGWGVRGVEGRGGGRGPLPQARQVRGGPRGVGQDAQPALTDDVGVCSSAIESEEEDMATKEKLQCLKDFHKDILEAVPGRARAPGRRTRPREAPQREKGQQDRLCALRGRRLWPAWATLLAFPYLCYKTVEVSLGWQRAG